MFNKWSDNGLTIKSNVLPSCFKDLFNAMKLELKSGEEIEMARYMEKDEVSFDEVKSCIKRYFKDNPLANFNKDGSLSNKKNMGNRLLLEQVQRSIIQYSNLIKFQETNGEDTSATLRLKNLLLKQFKEIMPKNVTPPIKQQPLAEEKKLKDIFSFYCKQQFLVGNKPTFDQLNSVLTNMNLGEYIRFCKDFNIDLPLSKLKEIFKKTAHLRRRLDYEHFKIILQRIAHEWVEYRINKLQNNTTSEHINKLKELSEEDRLKALNKHMGLESPIEYKKHMVGMMLPFNTREKVSKPTLSKIGPVYLSHKTCKTEESKKEVVKSRIRPIHHTKKKRIEGNALAEFPRHEERRVKAITRRPKRITWSLLNKLSYNDININSEKGELQLEDIITHSTNEENEIFKKLQINSIKTGKQPKASIEERLEIDIKNLGMKEMNARKRLSSLFKSMERQSRNTQINNRYSCNNYNQRRVLPIVRYNKVPLVNSFSNIPNEGYSKHRLLKKYGIRNIIQKANKVLIL